MKESMTPEKMRAACAIVLISIVGCTVGPDYHRPDTPVPGGWVGASTQPTTQLSVATAQATNLALWWTAFNDPLLDSLVDRAIQSNLDLRLAYARIEEARAARRFAKAGFWPTANTTANYRRSGSEGSSVRNNILNNSSSSGRDLYQAGLDASWELDVF